MKLACLFTQTTLDDDGYPVRDPASATYLETFEPAGRFGQLLDAEARRRGAQHIRQLVFPGDGAAWIWNLAQLFPAATQIVDLYHAREHLHDLANLAARLLAGHRGATSTSATWACSSAPEWSRPVANRSSGSG